jgi:hypothetical protein
MILSMGDGAGRFTEATVPLSDTQKIEGGRRAAEKAHSRSSSGTAGAVFCRSEVRVSMVSFSAAREATRLPSVLHPVEKTIPVRSSSTVLHVSREILYVCLRYTHTEDVKSSK